MSGGRGEDRVVAFSEPNSPLPQLIDTTETPGKWRAKLTVFIRSPRLSELASTTSIDAPAPSHGPTRRQALLLPPSRRWSDFPRS